MRDLSADEPPAAYSGLIRAVRQSPFHSSPAPPLASYANHPGHWRQITFELIVADAQK
jgi:hypothetical protein